MPAPASVRAVKSFWRSRSWTFTSGNLRLLRELQIAGGLAALDQGVDVAGPPRVEEHVALADARLFGEQARFEHRLPDGLGELAVVAGEAAREMRELGVVAAPFAHPVEALEDPARDAARGVGVVVRARDRAGSRGVEERQHRVLVLGERRVVGRAPAEAG